MFGSNQGQPGHPFGVGSGNFNQITKTGPGSGNVFGGSPSTTVAFGSMSSSQLFSQAKGVTPGISPGVAPQFGKSPSTVSSSGSGQNMPSSGSLFGGNTVPVSSTFGQATQGTLFGSVSSSAMFGAPTSAPTSSSGFGVKNTSGPLSSTAPSSTTFGAAPVASSSMPSNVFGSGKTGQSNSPFGGSLSSGVGSTVGSTASSIFGGSKPVFGEGSTSGTSTSVFGGGAGFSQSGSGNVFKSASSGSMFGGGTSGRSSGFGPSVFGGSSSGVFTSSSSASVFGGQKTVPVQASDIPSKSIKDSEDKNRLLFGQSGRGNIEEKKGESKRSPTKEEGQPRGLFGISTDTLSAQKTDGPKPLFGAAKNEPQEPRKALFGGPSRETGREKGSASDRREKPRLGAGLFGKAIADVAGLGKRKASQPGQSVSPESTSRENQQRKPKEFETQIVRRNIRQPQDTEDSEATQPRQLSRRRSTVEDLENKLSIVCKNVPQSVNNKMALRKHFSQYGKVAKVYPNPSKGSATIHFSSHADAVNAKKKGRKIKRGLPAMYIFFGTYSPTSRRDSRGTITEHEDEAGSSKPSTSAAGSRKLGKGSEAKPASKRLTYVSEVDDELAALQGTADVEEEEIHILSRPEEGASDKDVSPEVPSRRGRSPSPARRALMSSVTRTVSPNRSAAATSVTTSTKPKTTTVETKSKSASAVRSNLDDLLKSLSSSVGHTANERRSILKERDKLVRQVFNENRPANLATSKFLRGSCPDMCPELERYVREDQRRLALYEIVPGSDLGHDPPKVDHMRAVKEYSRSSADQEVPLPHELRSAPVLAKTMTYLLNNIADLGGEGKWADWYDFLWNRTRGIRKDITQQSLCDMATVELVEKCARFHIYCSERLCEEDMMVFDTKINNENLTKCLQTLKEFYYDLRTRHGQVCPNEAEFRAYMVLMNLNEGDILRQVQNLQDDVRKSPAVTFTLAVYQALNSNNYIRFFKLVRRASFLNACILHRYFNQIRSQALQIMVRMHTSLGRPVTNLPVSALLRQLAFEDDSEAIDFCGHYGLAHEEGFISLDKRAFDVPEVAFEPQRAIALVESKLTVSVGEVKY